MNLRDTAKKLKGWNTVKDIENKLKVKRSTAYVYITRLNKSGFVNQKVKRPRGTMYFISPIPNLAKHFGIYEKTEFVAPEIEFTNKEITPEQKIAYFLSKFKKERNLRYFEESKRLIRGIKNWKRLYRYLKAYGVKEEFKKLYTVSRKKIKKVPRMPKRYKKFLGV
jgi:hypothetical protein